LERRRREKGRKEKMGMARGGCGVDGRRCLEVQLEGFLLS
jgi:hypothetical protein